MIQLLNYFIPLLLSSFMIYQTLLFRLLFVFIQINQKGLSHYLVIRHLIVNLSWQTYVSSALELNHMWETVLSLHHLQSNRPANLVIFLWRLNVHHAAYCSWVVVEHLGSPDLGDPFACSPNQIMVVIFYSVQPERLIVLETFPNAEMGSQVSGSCPIVLSSWPFACKVASYDRFDNINILITQVKESSAFGREGPFVEVGKVSIRLQIGHIDHNLVDGMCCINEKSNIFLFEELDQRIHRNNKARHWNDMIKNSQPDLLRVAIHKILHS